MTLSIPSGRLTPRCFKAVITLSVGIFPTNEFWANGQPPSPPIAESNLRQPASYAARIFECRDALRRDCALGALFIDHDANDFHIVRRVELIENLFAVRHLRDGFWRNKTHGVDVFEAGVNQAAKILNFQLSRDLARQALPGVARTLD